MKTDRLMNPNQAKYLTERLSRISTINRYDRPGEPQSATIALTLTDIEESCRNFLTVLLPQILDRSKNDEELKDILHEIGEEFRHILYHIKDPRFYSYLFDEKSN